MSLAKVTIRTLPLTQPPIPEGGGRIRSAAGELVQIVNGEQFRFLAYIEFKQDAQAVRGNHYHARKTEIMYIISGRLQAKYMDLDSGESMKVILGSGDLVTIRPKCAHAYYPLEYSQVVEMSATVYDPTDTITHKLDLSQSLA
ncbi:MAG: cupin domain-containing protein [Pseudonocardiales bacterium]